jgi:hypothetical protein
MNDELTLYEICANDYTIFSNLESDKEIMVEVWDDKHETVYKQKSNQYAWDSLVSFAKMILSQDKKIQKEIENDWQSQLEPKSREIQEAPCLGSLSREQIQRAVDSVSKSRKKSEKDCRHESSGSYHYNSNIGWLEVANKSMIQGASDSDWHNKCKKCGEFYK